MSGLKEKAISGIFWSGIDRFSVQGILFVVQIVMARVLLPSDYGVIGMLTFFIAISQSFINSGFSNALIRKSNSTDIDYSTVFYFNIFIGILFYFILFYSAPFIAQFYSVPALTDLTRVVGLSVFFESLVIVQRARHITKLNFKILTKSSLFSACLSGIVGILLAYSGWGVWAIALQMILNNILNAILLWILSAWIPKCVFSKKSFNELFFFGSKLLFAGLIDTIYKHIYILVIGKFFHARELGFYTRANQFAQFPSGNLTTILAGVFYPILSKVQGDPIVIKKIHQKYIRLTAFFVFPLMIGIAVLARPLIFVLLSPEWEGTIILLQIICFAQMFSPISAINLNLIQIKGYSNLYLKLEMIKKLIGVIVLIITIPLGIIPMCIGMVCVSFVELIINAYYPGKFLGESVFDQLKFLVPILLFSLSMGGVICFFISFISSHIIALILGSLIGMGYYLSISFIFRSEELMEMRKIQLLIKQKIYG